jgi:peptide/nickel transport system substrate-binding protein
MHRRFWLLAGPAAVLLLLAASATATTKVAGTALAADATPAAAPFAQSWAQVPRTTEGRKAANIVVVGEEQDVTGFNVELNCCSGLAPAYLGEFEAQRGAFNLNEKGVYFKDLVSAASASKTGISYTIRPDAYWYWGGRKLPLTYKDFVYTWQQFVNPANQVITRSPYNQIGGFTHKGDKQITFTWKKCGAGGSTPANPCGPYANWQSAFSVLYPAQALAGMDFNKIWTNCICGNDGKPVSDGPFYLSNYTRGQGTTLKANPFFYKKAKVREIDFKLVADTDTEVVAMRGGEYDLIVPTFGLNLAPLKTTPGLTFQQVPSYFFEHLDLQEGPKASNPLLRNPWMREAIMLGLDRQALINTIYGPLAGNTKPLNSAVYFASQATYKPDFAKWNYNPAKALALLKKHCTGGPSSPDPGTKAVWTCAGFPAQFRWSWTAEITTRTTQEAIAEAQLRAIGIKIIAAPRAANVFFGQYLSTSDYDIANFAWTTSDGDPGNFYDIWRCGGDSNYLGYCSKKASRLMAAAQSELDPAKRAAEWNQADAIMASNVPTIPLYQRPFPLIHKSGLLGVQINPGNLGPFWSVENWHWKS